MTTGPDERGASESRGSTAPSTAPSTAQSTKQLAEARKRARNRSYLRAALLATLVGGTLWLTGWMERFYYIPTRERTPPPRWITPSAEAFWFESSDGTRLRGWFLPAVGIAATDAATVVHVHGNAGSMVGHLFFVEHLPEAGFNVLLFDYRGYGESEGVARRRGPLVQDAKAALRIARARPDVDPNRVALYGVSLGGAIAVLVAADDLASGGDVRSLLLESPFSSWRYAAATLVGGDPPAFWGRWIAAWLIKDHVEGVARPIDAIAEIDVPILILHGDADRTVAVGHGRRLAAAAPNAELVELRGGDHNSLQMTHPEVRRRMIEFLRETTGRKGRRDERTEGQREERGRSEDSSRTREAE